MATIESDMRVFLLADATVSGIVGTKVFAHYAVDGVDPPYVLFTRVDSGEVRSLTGASDLPRVFMSLVCVHTTYSLVVTLADAVRARLDDGEGSWNGRTVEQSIFTGDRDGLEVPPASAGETLFSRELDFEIWYRNT